MRCSYAMMSPSDTSLEEEEEVDVDGADQDGAEREVVEREGEAAKIRLLSPKLLLATFNGSGVYGTHDRKMGGRRKKNKKIA